MKISPRPYVMRERARSVEQTRADIIAATIDLALSGPLAQLTLQRVAERARVSAQTVLRQFTSRDGLIDAAAAHALGLVTAERTIDPDRPDVALRALLEHYERVGDGVLILLGQEVWEPTAHRLVTLGKDVHRSWVERQFAAQLARSGDPTITTDLLVAATDLSTWKLWRRDRSLSPTEVGTRMTKLIAAIIDSETSS